MNRFDDRAFRAIAWPSEGDSTDWLRGAEQSIEFLIANARSDEIIIYASAEAVLIQGVLAPTTQVTPADQDDLLHAQLMQEASWRIRRVWGGGEGHRIYLEAPLSETGSKSLVGGEKLVYRRSFTGVDQGRTPVELSQKLVHSLDLYWVEERSAFCRLDDRGDIEDVIRVLWLKRPTAPWHEVVVTVLTEDLRTYMAVSDMSLVLDFDFTRFNPKDFGGWHSEGQSRKKAAADLFYTLCRTDTASYVNGCMILRPTATVADLVQEWKDEDDPKNKRYATFKILDWKNRQRVETSCAPEFLSNYFETSDKPFAISPAFFRADVLLRFKADPEKFDLTDRTIGCRNAWYLKTYDINETGQVHTYIGYLANLPYEEQLYWQSFNEWPKGPISKRAFENDFEGKFSSEYDPLHMLKYKIRQLDESPPAWWKPRGDEILDAARYPATDSVSEWGDEVLALDQLIVEGFLQKPLQKLATAAGRAIEKDWQSLRLLQDNLQAQGRDVEEVKAITEPLVRLHRLRTILKGHGAPSERTTATKQARTEHGTLRAHFTALAGECDAAFVEILKSLGVAIKFE